jgi:ATP-dependent DNA helicase PIF1
MLLDFEKKHKDAMGEDYARDNPCQKLVEQLVLIDKGDMSQSMGKSIKKFPLPKIDRARDRQTRVPREIYEEQVIQINEADENLFGSLNTEQMSAYNAIMRAIDSPDGGVFFVDGPGGTGKTFLYRALLGKLRSQGQIVFAVATSGVAASI